jgi:hypothetical protein
MMFRGTALGSVTVMSGIEWFWAIVCNVLVVGGAVLTGMLFAYWFQTAPRRHHGSSPHSG